MNQVKKQDLQYVVAVDDSTCAKHALNWADFIANPKDKLAIIHSYDTEIQASIVKDRYTKFPKQNSDRYSLEILDDKRYNVDQRIKHYVNAGQQQTVDILVTGLYGKTYENLEKDDKTSLVGSTSDLSLRSARCSSFFVRREVAIPENQDALKMCVGVDGSQNSLHAFEFAIKLLSPNNTLYVVHIETEYSNNDELPQQYRSKNVINDYTKYIQQAKQKLDFKVNIEIKLIEGSIKISDALCKFAADNKCHILCVGADGMTAHCNKQPILGSVSDECVKDCECNIIVTQVNEYNATPRASFSNNF